MAVKLWLLFLAYLKQIVVMTCLTFVTVFAILSDDQINQNMSRNCFALTDGFCEILRKVLI